MKKIQQWERGHCNLLYFNPQRAADKQDTIKCTFEINGPNYRDGWDSAMKLLSKQTNMVDGAQTGWGTEEGRNCSNVFFHAKVKKL